MLQNNTSRDNGVSVYQVCAMCLLRQQKFYKIRRNILFCIWGPRAATYCHIPHQPHTATHADNNDQTRNDQPHTATHADNNDQTRNDQPRTATHAEPLA